MADSSVLLEVIVEGKNIKLVQREVEELGAAVNRTSMEQDKAATSTDKTTKAQNKQTKSGRDLYNNQRSIINGSLAQGRATAKLASGITGGLVPAYAEIVSNIFAVQQAFSVLQRAQALDILTDNLNKVGVAAGRNLQFVADSLRDITEGALSAKDALEATANATAQGFSTSQLEGLTRVAKGASAALGRDLTDSLDRLVRGTAKLEPEILDELGIIVRLDEATRDYAASVGKSVGDLTQFERQQAFLNATLQQGEKKFGSLADSTETNPYSKLAASFSDLTQTLLSLSNKVLVPITEFFAQNKLALTAALLFFVQTIANRLSPTLDELRKTAATALEEIGEEARNAGLGLQKNITTSITNVAKSSAKLPAGFKKVKDSILDINGPIEDVEAGIKSLANSENRRSKALAKYDGDALKAKQKELQDIYQLRTEVQNILELRSKAQGSEVAFFALETQIDQTRALGDSLEELDNAEGPINKLKATFKGISTQLSFVGGALKRTGTAFLDFVKGAGRGRTGLNLFQTVAALTTITVKGLKNSLILAGKAFINLIPFIGPLLFAFDLLLSAGKKLLNFFRSTTEETREVIKSFQSLNDISDELAITLNNATLEPSEKALATLNVAAGLYDQINSGLKRVNKEKRDENREDAVASAKRVRQLERRKKQNEIAFKAQNMSQAQIDNFNFSLDLQIEKEKKRLETIKKRSDVDRKQSTLALEGFLAQIEANENLKKVLEETGEYEKLTNVYANLSSNVSMSDEAVKALLKTVDDSSISVNSLVKSQQAVGETISLIAKESQKLSEAEDTRFSSQIRNFNTLATELKNLEDKGRLDVLDEDTLKNLNSTRDVFVEILGIAEGLGTSASIKAGVEQLRSLEDSMRAANAEAKRLSEESKRLGQISRTSAEITSASIDLQNQSISKQIEAKEAEITASRALAEIEIRKLDPEKASEEIARRRQQLEGNLKGLAAEVAALEAKKIDPAERSLRLSEAQIAGKQRLLALEEKIASAAATQADLDAKRARSELELQRAREGTGLTAEDEFNLVKSANDAKIEAEETRYKLLTDGIKLEYELLRAKGQFEALRIQALASEAVNAAGGRQDDPRVMAANRAQNAQASYLRLLNQSEEAALNLAKAQRDTAVTVLENATLVAEEKKDREVILTQIEGQKALLEEVRGLYDDFTLGFIEQKILKEELAVLEEDLLEFTGESVAKNMALNAITQKRAEIRALETSLADELLDKERALQSAAIKGLKERSKLNKELADLGNTNPFTGKTINVVKQQQIAEQERQERLKFAKMEAEIKKATLDAEFNLLKTRAEVAIAELQAKGLDTTDLEAAQSRLFDQQSFINELTKANIDRELELTEKKLGVERLREANAAIEAAAKETPGGGLLAAAGAIGNIFAKPGDQQQDPLQKKFEELFGGKTEGVDKTTEAITKSTIDQTMQTVQALAKGDELLKTGQQQAVEGNNSLIIAIQSAANQICECIRQANPGSSFTLDNGAGGAGAGVMPGANGMPTSAGTGAAEGTPPDPLATGGYSSEGIDDMINETSGGTATGDGAAEGGEGSSPVSKTVQGLMAARTLAKGFAADLKQLGPEGEAMSQFVEGGLALADSVAQIASSGGDMSAILGGVSAAIGAIGQMQQARAKQTIAAIDKEIAAEKKRDGQSKESQQKIAQLEAKKTAVQKKAFEQNKKIQMAQTVVNTAAAAMQMYASAPFPLNVALAAMAVAMGMYQLSIIRASTFDGGAASVGKADTPTIAVGKRSSTVDVAKSKSQSGELQYMRGGQGTGNINEFRPAFTGAQYRATGGSTMGYVVGEQGPELFIPETAGTVVPADETEEALTGTPINATFNINAIDATGVAQVLEGQRGNIIGMLRESANSYGNVFFEDVETAIYTDQTRGAERA